ncbi:MAG TPA: AMP-binding protein [Candidatus Bipolaricaulis anaerobius]|nr:AMP-binding protein [Candidatus Bipolaricaulis anaerobius]HNS23555.1 AMP-binding protein [Candidatus Bipolaricaulis anaerobius]
MAGSVRRERGERMSTGPNVTAYPGPGAVYNLGNILERNAAPSGSPDRPAVVDADRADDRHVSSYRALDRRANRFAQALTSLGVKKGDRVFVVLPNRVEMLEVLFGCLKVGAVFTPANFRFSAEEISFLIDDVDSGILVFDSEYAEKIQEVVSGHPGLRTIEIGGHVLSGSLDYRQLLTKASEDAPACPTAPDETAMILFTAGTTGHPKGVRLTHRSTFFACLANGISAALTRDDVYLGAPPMFHSGGLTCFQLYMLMINGKLILQRRWTPEGALALIKKYGVTYHFGIATQLKMMVQVPGWERCVSSLRAVNGGGEPQPVELKRAFIDQGITYICGYGLTETGATGLNWPASSPDDPLLSKASECMGKPPAFVEVKIVSESGDEVAPDEVGEIIIRREPTGAAGYWNRPEEEAKKFRGDWIFTGDLGKLDGDGYFYVLGRTDDMIISGGENIYPAEVERAIYSHPKVANVVVVRGKHPQWGQTPKAIVMPKEGQTITVEEILEHVSAHLASFKKPRTVVIVDSLPRSETGKIDRKAVKNMYEEL